jgi:hypothetical protein
MSSKIKRIKLTLNGIKGVITTDEIHHMMVPVFECEGFEYYVRSFKRDRWHVFKCASCRSAEAEYYLIRRKSELICDCPSGRRNLICRHKKMVLMIIGNNTIIEKNTNNQQVQQAQQKINVDAILARANVLHEKFEKMKVGMNRAS